MHGSLWAWNKRNTINILSVADLLIHMIHLDLLLSIDVLDDIIVASRAMCLDVLGGRIVIRIEGAVQGDPPDCRLQLGGDVGLDDVVLEVLLVDEDLARAADPVSVPSVARVLAEANVNTRAGEAHLGELGIPLVAPGVSVVVAGEYCHEAGCAGDSLHEGNILAAVPVGTCVGAVLAPALRLRGEEIVVVDAGVVVRLDAFHLGGKGREHGDVNKGQ